VSYSASSTAAQGYHQIALHPDEEDKTTFITPHGIYCYKVMTFGLKNARATYQKAIQKCLKTQIGKNVEAYVDDVVVKTTEEDKLIADLTETFANLREFQWKLHPTKCVIATSRPEAPGAVTTTYSAEAEHVARLLLALEP
jgi:hypothetical protein